MPSQRSSAATGVVACAAYLPFHRLQLSEIGSVLGGAQPPGTRSVASYDEDTTSMAVEAARAVLRGLPPESMPPRVYFATTDPAYLDKTNAAVIHAALNLPRSTLAVDLGGAPRSALGALLAAADSPEGALAVLADMRTGLPGSADERHGGDAAAAVLFGPGTAEAPILAELITSASVTEEFLDRWRVPGAPTSRVWEERFGEHVYVPLAMDSFAAALKQADLTPDGVDHLVVCGLSPRANRQFAGASGVPRGALSSDLTSAIGNPGTAQPGVLLADVLERAQPDQVIALTVLADGASTLILRTTDALDGHQHTAPTVADQIAAADDSLSYGTFLTWRGMLRREPPRRPEPEAPAGPPSHRSEQWKYGFVGSRCEECGTVHLPPVRVCYQCGSADRMHRQPMADTAARVATYTIDRLAYTPSPPMIAVVVDFDGGGRFRCELTDSSAEVSIGGWVEMTFRRLTTSGGGVHNYFWKARPARRKTEES
ncbi:zinc ribbon domain-containing protein [Mycolicibacterium gilvum]|uniref:Predicted nucleic-acid-binding protein containing a Zn-ribbon n=1 Tax=Mycolicibacterium gilvum TaxID=1804 RepID=A0A378SH14_9MYCO|nr:OB-fold domain-containing protein [Mycolicibacterium gilvum]MCV7057764.1 hydroxymethylglutaryl-CoA synthase [Mycolicibacterium gilvum]STZ41104.1 Predicted nucleic-acid-binding protein containing a Zn-ribbon [Mycolicibacterium gilvum]